MMKIKFELNIRVIREADDHCSDTTLPDKTTALPETQTTSFLEWAMREVEHRQLTKSPSTIENYRTALRSFTRFLGRRISVGDINSDLMDSYEHWLQEHSTSMNTISCYMRSLRSLVKGIDENRARESFKGVFTGREKTEKRAVTEDDIARIRGLRLRQHTFISLTRDLFLFSIYGLGMPFVDMCFLRKEQINEGRIVYHRHKTHQRICVPLEPCMEEIINRYACQDSDYVFPMLRATNPAEAYDKYLLMLNHYNRTLKKLAARAGINRSLTSYVSRHTWASVAYSNNVELPVISKALGHANPQNTLIYIKEINDDRLSIANHELLRKLKNKGV